MERSENHRLNDLLNAIIHAYEGRSRVYQLLALRVNCLLIKPFLMRGITSSNLCKTQLVNQLWNFGGRMSYDGASQAEWYSTEDHDDYEKNVRSKVDDNLFSLYKSALREDMPDSLRQLLTSQLRLLKSFVIRLEELEPETTNHYLLSA